MNHIGKPNGKCGVDSQGKHALNWMRQENSRTAFEIARDKVTRLELAFQTLESKARVLTGFLGVILAAVLGSIAPGQPLRRGRRPGLGQADMRVCREVLEQKSPKLAYIAEGWSAILSLRCSGGRLT